MKFSRRILSFILSIFMIATTIALPVSAASFTDIASSNKISTAVSVLSKLGVIKGYDDGTFKPDNNVTRAEFTAMLMRTRGLSDVGSMSLEDPPFPDVVSSDVSWAIGNIRTARSMGIINGYDDGTFLPNNNVLYEEAIKMIVCSLGYANSQPEGSEWFSKYINAGNSIGFLANAGGSIGVPATRGNIAMMLYNCLEVKLAEDDKVTQKTILEDDLKLTKNTGVIAANTQTSLLSPDVNIKENQIQIRAKEDGEESATTHTYVVENAADYKDMLGTPVTFYYKDNSSNERELVLTELKGGTAPLTIEASLIDITGSENNSVKYYPDEDSSKPLTAKIDSDNVVVYNGKLYGTSASDSAFVTAMLPKVGSIKLIDSDANGGYDVIFIEKYEMYLASSVTTSTYTIVDNVTKNTDHKSIVLDPTNTNDELKFVDAAGKETTFSSIKKGSVVCLQESNPSNGGTFIRNVIVVNKPVSGTIKGIKNGKSVTIGSTTYEYSDLAPWVDKDAQVTVAEPAMNDTGVYYLDKDGKLFAYDKAETTTNQMYGYLMQAAYNSDSIEGDTLKFNILTQSGSKTTYNTYKNTKINGTAYSDYSGMVNALKASATLQGQYDDALHNDCSQVIKFTTTTYQGATVIDDIRTVTAETTSASGADIVSDKLTMYSPMTAEASSTYSLSGKQLSKGANSAIIASAYVFFVPDDRRSTTEYKKGTYSELRDGKNYKAEVFDMSTAKSSKVIVIYGQDLSSVVDQLTPAYRILEVSQEINSNESETMYKISAFNCKSSSNVEIWGAPESESVVSTLKEGDIVRFGKNKDGFSTLAESDILFSITNMPTDKTNGYKVIQRGDGTAESPNFAAYYGSAYVKDNDVFAVTSNLLSGTDDIDDTSKVNNILLSRFAYAKIYLYSVKDGTLEITDQTADGAASVLDTLGYYNGSVEPSKVFMYMADGAVKTLIIPVEK